MSSFYWKYIPEFQGLEVNNSLFTMDYTKQANISQSKNRNIFIE